MLRYTKIALVTAALATAGAMAFAAKSTDNDALLAPQAKVSFTQAIAAAEQHAGGKASRAEYEKNKTGWVYDIEVISGAKSLMSRSMETRAPLFLPERTRLITTTVMTKRTELCCRNTKDLKVLRRFPSKIHE